MGAMELISMIGNGRQECQSFTLAAGSSVTCRFSSSGSDTATDKYFDLKDSALRVAIYGTADSELTHINGHELKSPLPLGDNWNFWKIGIRWNKVTVRATVATTFVVYAY